jgi:hypothetical protein
VPPEQSRNEIHRTVMKYGASAYGFLTDPDRGVEMVQFRIKDREIRFYVRLPREDEPDIKGQIRIAVKRTKGDILDAFLRERWRALALYVKAVCVAIDSEAITVDDAFMSAVVMPDNRTMGEHTTEVLDRYLLEGRLPPLLPG